MQTSSMTPRARDVLTGYPSWVNACTTGGMTIKWMAPSKSTNSTGNALRMIPAQDLLGCMKVPPLNNHPPFYHAPWLEGPKGLIHIPLSLGRGEGEGSVIARPEGPWQSPLLRGPQGRSNLPFAQHGGLKRSTMLSEHLII